MSAVQVGAGDDATALPGWLRPLAEAGRNVRATQLSRFLPPRDSAPRPASVLMLFGTGSDGPQVLLLERSHDLRSHAGQVAFPGGAQDPVDGGAVEAALREAEEETGLDPAGVQVIGVLPRLWLRPSNYAVTPVLAWWRAPCAVRVVDPAETASVHTVTVSELLDPANRVTVRHPSGFRGPAFCVRDLIVWGFTAGLLSRMFALAGWERVWDESRVLELPSELAASSMRDLAEGEID
ncbi:MAG: NUDIX hydrolase [Nocardioidaceae bacterium]